MQCFVLIDEVLMWKGCEVLGGDLFLFKINTNTGSEGWQFSASCLAEGEAPRAAVTEPSGETTPIWHCSFLVISIPLAQILGNLLQSPLSSC